MKRVVFMLGCSAVCLGVYFVVGHPGSSETAKKTTAVAMADNIQPLVSVVVSGPTRSLGISGRAVVKNEELSFTAVSRGEYIDPSDSSGSPYLEPMEVGEYIDPREPSYSNNYNILSVGEYVPVKAGPVRPDSDAVSVGEYVPLD